MRPADLIAAEIADQLARMYAADQGYRSVGMSRMVRLTCQYSRTLSSCSRKPWKLADLTR